MERRQAEKVQRERESLKRTHEEVFVDSDANSQNDSSISHGSDTDDASEDRFQRNLKPIGSIYGIFTYIYHTKHPNVGKYAIHGWCENKVR